ncbi:hypothetical protein B0H65DRAFT_333175 [Neurospora tetraspora]|uniref:mRNA export factor MEX67 n=1 Tax=Neurospora tetraspora TaxID=94610 RepID=A0AAE0J0S1_9PEZI|nr:hypothetical protein B0H65DRAFT_333175 [Neurospora tetraspora]
MAPPTGPRAGTARAPPRGPRATGGGGGGIQKRRANPRTDRDGDVSMDAPAGGSGRGGSASGGRGRGSKDARGGRGAVNSRTSSRVVQNLQNYVSGGPVGKTQSNMATLKILGMSNSKATGNRDGGLRSLLTFLERKASKDKAVTIGKSILDGDYVWITVRKDDAPEILRLNGFTYAGAPLTITETTERMPRPEDKISKAAEETKQKLTAVLAARYNPELKLLDLSSLGTDPILSSMGTFDSKDRAEKAFKVLVVIASQQYKTAAEKREGIQAISLASNGLNDVMQVFTLASSLPDIKRLDLSSNNLDSLSKIAKWQHRFQYLEELHLTGNPITTQPDFVAELIKWFPSLQNINGQIVRSPQEVAEALKGMHPTPLPQFPSNLRDGEANVASIFVQVFFPMFDTDRARLAAEFYDDDSWFSIQAIANSGRNLPWKTYLKYSRNVHKLGEKNPATVQRLFTGGNLIADMWKALPSTRHPSMENPGAWLIDCHTFPNLADPTGHGFATGLLITVNGQFEESDTTENLYGKRTFTRTFILGPSKPSNPPPVHPYRVISDQLTLHDWTPAETPAVQAPVANQVPQVPVTNAVPPAGPVILDDATKNQLIQEVMKRTGMTAEYSELCLSGTANWNFELALKSFEEQRANLPPTAFINAV